MCNQYTILFLSFDVSFIVFNNRKLIVEEPEPPIISNTTTIFCNKVCINAKIQGPCPIPCLSWCPEICNLSPISNKAPKSHKPSTFLIVSLCLLVATFLFVCCYFLYRKYYSPRTRRPFLDPQVEEENRDGDRVRIRFHGHEFDDHDQVPFHPIWYINTIGLQPSIINSITICKYKKGEGLIEGTDCSVCLSEFEEDETLRLLPKCSHAFHLPCIDTWLRSHTNCPLCRAPIVVNNVVTSNQQPEEETQVMVLENGNSEFGEQRENYEVPELRIRIEEEQEEEVEKVNQEVVRRRIEPSRRSVSLDSLSASKINASLSRFLERVSDGSSSKIQLSEVNKSKKLQRHKGSSSSKGRSNRNIGPVSMKRSLSSEGICRQIQHHDSNRPLRSF